MNVNNPNQKENINLSNDESSNQSFFLDRGVDISCSNPLKIIFDTLLLEKKCKQQELADFCSVDKAYISRVVNGLQIPPLTMRLKIASFFGVDSALIWRTENLPYIKKILKEQKKDE